MGNNGRYMVLCFNEISNADENSTYFQYLKTCKANPNIKAYSFEYNCNKKLFSELLIDFDGRILSDI